jgi:hypothetical protein
MDLLRNVVATFVIGVVAGVSPFLFLQLLPELLNPSQQLVSPNYEAIASTGVLVGLICTIIFAKTFSQRDPQEVFFYTLGIPAILVATVSNITTKSDAIRTVTAAQVAASAAIMNPPPPAQIVPLQEVPPTQLPPQGLLRQSGAAWAAERSAEGRVVPVQASGSDWIVVIGSYPTEADAWRRVRELAQRRLATENYIPKNLRVYKSGSFYYVSYTGPSTRDEATRIYNLLRVNNPELTPQILRGR